VLEHPAPLTHRAARNEFFKCTGGYWGTRKLQSGSWMHLIQLRISGHQLWLLPAWDYPLATDHVDVRRYCAAHACQRDSPNVHGLFQCPSSEWANELLSRADGNPSCRALLQRRHDIFRRASGKMMDNDTLHYSRTIMQGKKLYSGHSCMNKPVRGILLTGFHI
jgi:hypothetical protein